MDFEAFYDAYWREQGDVFDHRRQRLLARHVRPGDQVLQVDCGPGVLAARLQAEGAMVKGTDLSAEAVRRARERGIDARQVNIDREPLPFPNESFDVVLSDSQIEHRIDYQRYLDECVRVLRSCPADDGPAKNPPANTGRRQSSDAEPPSHLGRGLFVICVPNVAHWRVRWWLLLGRFPYKANTPTDWLHLRFFTLAELRHLFDYRGLRIVSVRGSSSLWVRSLYPDWLRRRPFARMYETLTRWRPTLFARDLVIVARKPMAAAKSPTNVAQSREEPGSRKALSKMIAPTGTYPNPGKPTLGLNDAEARQLPATANGCRRWRALRGVW